ncbi:MAG: hypothetical protein KDD10_27050 [Phaeodactylibacter sp.]|nr:hypothetical protein [Phaeodactylibacter sp.]
MEIQEVMKNVEQYLAYWQTYIQPLVDKEPKRYLHFTDTLNQVGKRFYGPDFSIQFNIAVFLALDPAPGGPMSDKGNRLEQ